MAKGKIIYGLIGYPLEHSLSPLMHNTAFKELKIRAEYKLFPLHEDKLDSFFEDLRKEKSLIAGLNVTVPYKERVMKYIDVFSPFAEKTGAVNTIVIEDGRKFSGYNTDGPGFLTHLKELECDTTGKRISILGAGGAARAIVSVLCLIPERPESIKIYDVDKEKADHLIIDLGRRFNMDIVSLVDSIDDLNIEISDMLINATPVGMKKDDPILVDPTLLHSNLFVYDLIYNPEETPLLRTAREKGARTANGLGMLFYQGVLAFQHWADMEIDIAVKARMRESLQSGINKREEAAG